MRWRSVQSAHCRGCTWQRSKYSTPSCRDANRLATALLAPYRVNRYDLQRSRSFLRGEGNSSSVQTVGKGVIPLFCKLKIHPCAPCRTHPSLAWTLWVYCLLICRYCLYPQSNKFPPDHHSKAVIDKIKTLFTYLSLFIIWGRGHEAGTTLEESLSMIGLEQYSIPLLLIEAVGYHIVKYIAILRGSTKNYHWTTVNYSSVLLASDNGNTHVFVWFKFFGLQTHLQQLAGALAPVPWGVKFKVTTKDV